MRLLVDTHALLWLAQDDRQLPAATKAVLEDTGNEVFVSAASAWEIAIKAAAGRLDLRGRSPEHIIGLIGRYIFTPLHIAIDHALRAGQLQGPHSDPFDRMLVAQAQAERLTLVTGDDRIRAYDVETLW